MLIFLFLIFLFKITFSQISSEENIGIQEVLVVKPYTPSLSDALKIKSVPKFPDSLISSDNQLIYIVKAVPVFTTFEPNKASPIKLNQRSSSTPYNTIFSGAVGNKNQLFVNISSVIEINRNQRFGFNYYRDGFGTNVNNTILKSNQNYGRFGLNHNFRSTEYNANTHIEFKANTNNYFGLYNRDWDLQTINSIDPTIKRSFFKFSSIWNWYDLFLKRITFQANLNSDNYNTSEQEMAVESKFEIDLNFGELITEIHLVGFNSRFDSSFFENQIQEFTQGKGIANLFWRYNKSGIKFKIGAGGVYLNGVESISSNFLYYPKVEISYQKNENILSPYLNANGGVFFNTYKTLSEYNPYLAPISNLQPTFKRYNAILGVRTRLSSVLNFDFGILYDQVENFNYFERLPYDNWSQNDGYRLSNSFQSKYINTDIYGIKANFRIDLAKNNFIHFETLYRIYNSIDNQNLWNVPSLEMNWKSQLKLSEQFSFSINGNLWGDRKAAFRPIFIDQNLNNVQIISENLPIFLTTAAHLTYKISEQFDIFIKSRFNSSGIHGRWLYFKEPPLLFVGGLNYKFDFQY